jgi:hypothetical protein
MAFLVGRQMLHDEDRRRKVGGELAEHGAQSLQAAGRRSNDDDVMSTHCLYPHGLDAGISAHKQKDLGKLDSGRRA